MGTNNVAVYLENVTKEYKLGVLDAASFREELKLKLGLAGANTAQLRPTIKAVDDVSLRIDQGERIGLFGKHGAGKSTLLKMICRITEPTTGFIGVNGKITSMLEVGAGFHPELTGKENIYLGGSILGLSKESITERFDEIVDFSGIREFIDTPVKRYSLGMYARLAFAVSIHLDADIIILDEILATGDAEFRAMCLKRLKSIAEEGKKTVLYVSHNMETVKTLCNRCVVMDQGRIVFDGEVTDAEEKYYALVEDR